MQVHGYLRRYRRLPSGIHLHHAPGPADAALWIADALCGAITQDRQGDGRFLKTIEKQVSLHVLDT